ncbi:hypothetical protein D9758_008035 [Tetrapyrgos nigripes]|uniref:histidine kinase n=1 Tax=Tetrapyrgos nigripes TaxID=182062 RepID=A0A8H5D1B2_9AGAR|nr:hypothetical protein D9758_008035 [Tetrapyrgos nigripes]
MSASGTIAKSQEIEFNALEGSLSMMSKVLNDVLDFNRMDSGKFESVARPYPFHQVMRSMFLPLRLATNHRELELVTELDSRIDEVGVAAEEDILSLTVAQVARRAAYEALGQSPETIDEHLKAQPNGTGVVVGDETRLRQLVTNLASNACKFTPAGGSLTIRTKLIHPAPRQGGNDQVKSDGFGPSPECSVEGPINKIIVRVEITDTGSGIRPQDMAQTKLFSAFNQTEQGGKGTGLGLALVRLIVQLSGGRLGVRSKVGQGSTFWFDLPLGVGISAIVPDELDVSPSATEIASFRNLPTGSRRPRNHRNESMRSKHSILEAIDASCIRATQASPVSLRSSSALQGLMNQGGSVELNLARYDSHSAVPTRTIGDPSTGTDFPPPDSSDPILTRQSISESIVLSASPTLEDEDISAPTTQVGRPRSSSKSPLPIPASPSPLCNQAFPPSPSPETHSESPVDQIRVLVVDDDKLTRTLMQRLMERLGCLVTTAENGEIALKILLEDQTTAPVDGDHEIDPLKQGKFSIVFLDNQMPVLSGLKVVEKLRELGRHDFVVGVTGNALLSDQKEYLDAGVDHVLTKPVLERSLRSMLQLAEERRKLSRLKHTSLGANSDCVSVSEHS